MMPKASPAKLLPGDVEFLAADDERGEPQTEMWLAEWGERPDDWGTWPRPAEWYAKTEEAEAALGLGRRPLREVETA